MGGFHDQITAATGVTDHALLNDIEDIMRDNCGGALDQLAQDEFETLALEAREVALLTAHEAH